MNKSEEGNVCQEENENFIKFSSLNRKFDSHKYGMWITWKNLVSNVEIKYFSKIAGYKMNLPFRAVQY